MPKSYILINQAIHCLGFLVLSWFFLIVTARERNVFSVSQRASLESVYSISNGCLNDHAYKLYPYLPKPYHDYLFLIFNFSNGDDKRWMSLGPFKAPFSIACIFIYHLTTEWMNVGMTMPSLQSPYILPKPNPVMGCRSNLTFFLTLTTWEECLKGLLKIQSR